ncbi:MAG: TIGR00282 family metallophosphoesterase [Calditrichaeota bacterium]|nr:TIGR00282 family metallophosphoesterase [Calditrichota bacterium]
MSAKNIVTILFIADIVGDSGLAIFERLIRSVQEKVKADFTIVNGENLNKGKGIRENIANHILQMNVDIITSGNHIWDRKESVAVLRKNPLVLRPINYPSGNPGHGSAILEAKDGTKVGIINAQGRTFMMPTDDPFRAVQNEVHRLSKETKVIFVDFHAEATAEKITLGWFLDGKVSAVIGTHTHVQTADERILPGGTAYITDAGMTGPFDSVIGMKKEIAIQRFLYGTPRQYEVASENLKLNGVFVRINRETGKAVAIERIQLP